MAIDKKPLESVGESDLQNLLENQVTESKILDYKEILPGNSDKDRKEFLFDVSSFANASGGNLVYGIREEDGVPVEICGLQDINPDEEVLRMESMIRDGINPRIPGVSIRSIPLSSSNCVIVIRIPKSWASPHMVTFKGSSKFYSRNSAGKYQLDVSEIRGAFLLSETIAERIRNFRAERLGKIVAGETPTRLNDNPKIVLHIVPFGAFDPGVKIDLSQIHNLPIAPINSSGWSDRYNFNGILRHYLQNGYVQVFRNGIIEAVDAHVLEEIGGNRTIRMSALETELIQKLQMYFSAQKILGVEPPTFIMLSLLNILNYTIYAGERYFREGHPIDRDVLVIPELVVESFDYDPAEIMKPVFDTVWNAAGWEGSINYNKEGRRVGTR